ncbi:MAG: GHKL domain-containing protein, partial [Lachnospiraceae bacterium]|nr:GHKL domain-containing protein [Lachnospiraceae bacterium]
IEASSKMNSADTKVSDGRDTEEAKEGQEAENAWVKMDIKRTEKFFVIKIANAASQQVDVEKLFSSSGYTSKKDKEHHGFGLRNIRMAVEDYDGLVKAESDESSFALSIMIPRK